MNATAESSRTESAAARQEGRIRSNAKKELIGVWLATFGWLAIMLVLQLVVFPREIAAGERWAWLIPLGWAVGLYLLYQAARLSRVWRRFGAVELVMDPYPGSLGGHVGGTLELPLRGLWQPRFDVALACLRVVRKRDAGRTRHDESIVWKEQTMALAEPSADGLRLRFTFDVPADLPPSTPGDDKKAAERHRWVVRLTGDSPGAELQREFEIPVERQPAPLTARQPARLRQPPASVADVPDGICRIERGSEGLVLFYPARRHRVPGAVLAIFGGLLFGACVYFFFAGLAHSGADLPLAWLVLVLFAIVLGVFALSGLVFALLGLYLLLGTLRVVIGAASITSTHRILGIAMRRELALNDVERIEMIVDGHIGKGAAARESYAIRAFGRDGRRIVLGDGIAPRAAAEAIAELIEQSSREPVEFDAAGARRRMRERISR